ncbi:MAG: hypothetical protein H0U76_14940 [Ktedonobacteraceae bacterium]|nr:hypothetical protein [Ktedonobacteraceae bacterium]
MQNTQTPSSLVEQLLSAYLRDHPFQYTTEQQQELPTEHSYGGALAYSQKCCEWVQKRMQEQGITIHIYRIHEAGTDLAYAYCDLVVDNRKVMQNVLSPEAEEYARRTMQDEDVYCEAHMTRPQSGRICRERFNAREAKYAADGTSTPQYISGPEAGTSERRTDTSAKTTEERKTEMSAQLQEKTFTTDGHTLIVNEAGVVLVESTHNRGWCVRLEPQVALYHAEYLLAHRDELEQLQKRLQQSWFQVAEEVKQRFEAQDEEGAPFLEATDHDIRRVLEGVAGADEHGSFTSEPTSQAGRWYRSLWNADGSDTTTYEQQWPPFLRTCRLLQERLDTNQLPRVHRDVLPDQQQAEK